MSVCTYSSDVTLITGFTGTFGGYWDQNHSQDKPTYILIIAGLNKGCLDSKVDAVDSVLIRYRTS